MTGTHVFDWGTFSESEPFSGFLPESDYPLLFPGGIHFNSTGRVYAVDAKNKHLIPPKPGVYAIREKEPFGRGAIYCGRGRNLNQRVRQSIREQGFGTEVIFFNEDNVSIREEGQYYQLCILAEKLCIRALSTICAYNNLPIKLSNQQHRDPLPYFAWKDPKNSPYKLPISFAQHVLSKFMPPLPEPHKISPFEYTYRLWTINRGAIPEFTRREKNIWAPSIVDALTENYLEPFDEPSAYRQYFLDQLARQRSSAR
ncbi:hypothetical protein [Thioclava sp. IC9]|uniref:hypothetical protein n=1 Tax=Thioclava sp. IC9 TaxID=1973007 RepID=UPI001130E611|nr:hypothetical protein [Thioclava sp. IC9]